MALTREQAVGAGLIAGAALLGYAALRRRKERLVKCDQISNRAGGTMAEPCPTEGPLDVCTFDGDYGPWRERLGIQLDAVQRLQRNMEDIGVLEMAFFDAIDSYTQQAVALIGQFAPAWTTQSDITPFLNQLRIGCELLNEGNAVLVKAGRPEYVVQEATETEAFARTAKPPSRLWLPLVLVGVVGGAYYVGQRIARR